jgi:hypothetical protein
MGQNLHFLLHFQVNLGEVPGSALGGIGLGSGLDRGGLHLVGEIGLAGFDLDLLALLALRLGVVVVMVVIVSVIVTMVMASRLELA